MSISDLKKQAALRAVEFIRSEMVVGLGHGSTTAFAIERIAQLLDTAVLNEIVAIPCSLEVEAHARRLGIPLGTLEDYPVIDLTIDGADEVDERMDLIKGGGGALLREKVVACASQREIIIVDGSKLSPRLGMQFALPVEVIPFAWTIEKQFIESLGAVVSLRGGKDKPFSTDQGNVILDCRFSSIDDAPRLARLLNDRAGIVEHGLFIDLATDLIVADEHGVRHLKKDQEEEATKRMPENDVATS
jgi:ribose 5-phosphate isomerase A